MTCWLIAALLAAGNVQDEAWLQQTNLLQKGGAARVEKLPDVLILGDSISLGYTGMVKAKLKGVANVSRPACNCGPSQFYLSSMKGWVGTNRWDVIHVNFGIWDNHYLKGASNGMGLYWGREVTNALPPIARGTAIRDLGFRIRTPAKEYEKNMRTILGYLKTRADRVVFGLTTPLQAWQGDDRCGRIRVYNEIATAVCEDLNVEVDDLYAVAERNLDKQSDGVHYHPAGYEALAESVVRSVTNALTRAAVRIVEDRPGYNSWPMIQAVNGRLVCLYSVGLRHSIGDGERGTWAKTSADGGRTWSKAVAVANDGALGEVPIGKGLDENGAALFWVRCCGERPSHDLYRTTDGAAFEKVASLGALDPMPTQITDVFKVPGEGLMALWFYCTYGGKGSNSWGTLVSADNGRTWKQRTVEGGLPNGGIGSEEPSAVYLGGGRILGITRGAIQGQITSTDSGRTWTRRATNIKDVCCTTPSLIYDPATGVVKNYYYQRGAGLLKCRTAKADDVFDSPLAWPEPVVLAAGGKVAMDTGNANAVRMSGLDYIAYYSGKLPDTSVLVAVVPEK